jgi:hypothetical protein
MYFYLEVVGPTEHLTSEHLAILAAVENGDAALAARLTQEHLATSHDFILTFLLENQATANGLDVLIGLHARRHSDAGPELATALPATPKQSP